jgi:hypothetical protein
MTVPRSATNRILLQYLGSHLYFQYFRTESPDGDALARARERGRAGRHRSNSCAHQRAQPRNVHFRRAQRMTASSAFSPLPLECRTTGMSRLPPFPKRSSLATPERTDPFARRLAGRGRTVLPAAWLTQNLAACIGKIRNLCYKLGSPKGHGSMQMRD